jgi:major membrane immunogen (membrane-anchored lipoprotein)
MKITLITLFLVVASHFSFAQTTSEVPTQIISTDTAVRYRLFSTRNMYTFIKLDTRNGKMWQVQWNNKGKEYRFESTLSDISQVKKDEEKNGRFFLYPTTNIYTFILLDQVDGRTWQVQWGKEDERLLIRIY